MRCRPVSTYVEKHLLHDPQLGNPVTVDLITNPGLRVLYLSGDCLPFVPYNMSVLH